MQLQQLKLLMDKVGIIMIRITTVMDNVPSEHKALIAKHGVSYYVETPGGNVLFDCGSDESIVHNMKLLGINIPPIKHFVGSHGHYDHGGGFLDLLKEGFKGNVYTGEGYFDRKLASGNGKYTFLGLPFNEKTLTENNIEYNTCRDVMKIFDDCFVVTNFPRIHTFETVPQRFVLEKEGKIDQDNFDDEVCLVISTQKGLVVLVGCSHPGILNMLDHIKEKLGQNIYAVLGGTHLVEADEKRINITIDRFEELDIKFIGLSHCSGEAVQKKMKDRGMDNSYLSAGSVVIL